jgi:hypothetical protein
MSVKLSVIAGKEDKLRVFEEDILTKERGSISRLEEIA